MNIKEYIESGILEEYVLGTASPQERREVECLSSIYPEIRQELDSLSVALEQYALTLRRDPPADIKENLLKTLDFTPPAASEPKGTPIRPLYPIDDPDSRPTYRVTWLVAASVGLLMLVFAFFLYSQLQTARQSVAELQSSKEKLEGEVEVLRERQTQSDLTLAMLKEPGMRAIRLNPTDSTRQDLATVYWNTDTGQVSLEVDSLTRPPDTQQYQLWAIVDGQPVDAGVFDIGEGTQLVHQTLKFTRADAFAITLERRGGSPTPTMTAMVVMGNVKS
ncbi:anti-sigma factor [Larkinella soli]|uniref:anti-sigma factor n=1 Tax=Larkinella soli TaxID=1770527 RepID=UPI000FFC158D|nr:anti-sigma factor [Larkinella soli]